jgi:uncharacterized repeat protein (TIGR01451 family)
MKTPFSSAAATGVLIAALASSAHAQLRPTTHAPKPDYDKRAPAQQTDPAAQKALVDLKSQLSSAAVDFDGLLGTPKFARSQDGFLTGPNGEGRAVSAKSLQAISASDPDRGVKAFLNEHSSLYGHGAEALVAAKITRTSITPHNGLRTVVWQQQLDGIPVFESVLIGNTTKRGELVSLSSQFLPNLSAIADAGTPARATVQGAPPISATDAILRAAADLGETWDAAKVTATGQTAGDGYSVFTTPRKAWARMVWLPLDRNRLRLGWEVMIDSHGAVPHRYTVLIDAQDGQSWLRRSLTHYISDATYNVYTSDSPSPFSPGWPTPNAAQPPLTNRVLVVTNALDVNASPAGWIPDGSNTTTGNNTDTFVDRNNDGQPDQPRPTGNPNRVFDFPLDLTLDPSNYVNAATVQMFYWVNYYHDRAYQLGFTEAAGNYQENNFGRGGLGSDSITAYVQSGADVPPPFGPLTDNAFFTYAPEGINPNIAMFVWDGPRPWRDGDLDTDVIFHEATHGTSGRLVGGGVGISALQTGGMGEGWSDFFALSLASQAGDDPDAVYAAGAYSSYQLFGLNVNNYYFGLRHYPYCTDLAKNPFTFKDIDPGQVIPHIGVPLSAIYPFNVGEADEVHHQGEVWCVTLWDVRANLIHKYGFAANEMMLQMAIDGMKLGPANPTFLQARDAILLADRVNNSGADLHEMWLGFAKRGMGFSAVDPSADTTAGIIEAYDIPSLTIDSITILGGNGNGIIDINECNDLQIALVNFGDSTATHIVGRLSSTTPETIVAKPVSSYPDTPKGATNVNLTPFKLNTSELFTCGKPIDFVFQVKSDQETRTFNFRLETGTNGPAFRYDNAVPVAIPDANPFGASSPINVVGFNGATKKVSVSMYLTHTFDSDLFITLIAPDGTTNVLSANRGGSGNNFGTNCSPDASRTTFDDEATRNLSLSAPPFVGTFKPESPFVVFEGKAGTNVNGTWQLHAVDQFGGDTGRIECWSLFLTPSVCVDGGGLCPGLDLAIGMLPNPEPVFQGSNLVYSISITNLGPNTAKNVILSQVLPPSAIFGSATISQGGISSSGGTVTGNIGTMNRGDIVTATVTVVPIQAGILTTTATVTSLGPENDPANNTVTVSSHVNPPFADLAVGLLDAPDPVTVGQLLTYTVSVTNRGPSPASFVTVTNTLPVSVGIQDATPSQGFITISGNVVVCNFGTITNSGIATATINVVPIIEGTIIATASATAAQVDPILGNNTASQTTVVGPSADLAIGIVDVPDPVVTRSNLTYVISVTNRGPSSASGVVINDTLPAGVSVVSTNSSQGSISVSGSTVTCALGNLTNGARTTLTVVVTSTNSGTIFNTANVTGNQSDPVPSNNSAVASTVVSPPFVSFVAERAVLTFESLAPTNGTVDPGESVTVNLYLRNAGNVVNTNLIATLLAINGVTLPSSPQNYGILAPSATIARPFSFTASGAPGDSIVATLQLKDVNIAQSITNNLGTVAFTFILPSTVTFANTNRIDLPSTLQDQQQPGPASPYPSPITVSGVTGLVGKVTVTLSNLNHTFPHDLNFLLVGPNGARTILMSDAADGSSATAVDLTFDDSAPSALPASGGITSGAWKPSVYDPAPTFTNPAPAGPYSSVLSVFNGPITNGDWKLFANDDSAGDFGAVVGGWSITFTVLNPVNQIADLLAAASVSPNPVFAGNNLTNTFSITNSGPNDASQVWVTNVLSPNEILISADNTLHAAFTTNGNNLVCNVGGLAAGASVKFTIVASPTAAGLISNTASVTATSGEVDLNPANNSASAIVTANLPQADLGLAISASPNPVTVGSNLTTTIIVTNSGPNSALNVVVSNALPAGVSYVSGSASQGTVLNLNGVIVANLGTIPNQGSASITFGESPFVAGSITNTARVTGLATDGNSVNNSASAVSTALNPAPLILVPGVDFTSESVLPANGTLDAGETVTAAFAFQNAGAANTVNLVATLLAINGVTSPSGPVNLGALVHGGAAVNGSFTFTAGSAPSGVVTATFQLQDGANDLGLATFTFNLPNTAGYTNNTAIAIPDHGPASPYPSTISVSGLTGLVGKVTVSLNGVTHGFPDDIDIILVSPTGQKVVLMSDTGGGHSITNVNLSFDDSASSGLPDSSQIDSGTYKPTDFEPGDNFPPPAPAGTVSTFLSAFNGLNPNGNWSLYVVDDATGDSGSISSWSLAITTITPVSPAVNLVVTLTDAPDPVFVDSSLTYTITLTNRGPSTATGVFLSDVLAPGVTLVSSNTTYGTFSLTPTIVTINVGTLSSGAGLVATLRVSPSVAGVIPNTATATNSAAQVDLDPTSNVASINTTVLSLTPATLTIEVVGQQLLITITAEPGQTYTLQGSTNFTTWSSVFTGTVPSGGILKFLVPNSSAARFFRSVHIP